MHFLWIFPCKHVSLSNWKPINFHWYKNFLLELFSLQRSFIKGQVSNTSSDNESHRVVQRVTANDNEWQRMTRSGTTRDHEWQQMTVSDNEWQRVITNDNEWQQVDVLANFLFSWIREKPATMRPKETL